jgi:hypothetical protein
MEAGDFSFRHRRLFDAPLFHLRKLALSRPPSALFFILSLSILALAERLIAPLPLRTKKKKKKKTTTHDAVTVSKTSEKKPWSAFCPERLTTLWATFASADPPEVITWAIEATFPARWGLTRWLEPETGEQAAASGTDASSRCAASFGAIVSSSPPDPAACFSEGAPASAGRAVSVFLVDSCKVGAARGAASCCCSSGC